jgi:hypothetical protein
MPQRIQRHNGEYERIVRIKKDKMSMNLCLKQGNALNSKLFTKEELDEAKGITITN